MGLHVIMNSTNLYTQYNLANMMMLGISKKTENHFNTEQMFETQIQSEWIGLLIHQALDVFNSVHCLRINKLHN